MYERSRDDVRASCVLTYQLLTFPQLLSAVPGLRSTSGREFCMGVTIQIADTYTASSCHSTRSVERTFCGSPVDHSGRTSEGRTKDGTQFLLYLDFQTPFECRPRDSCPELAVYGAGTGPSRVS